MPSDAHTPAGRRVVAEGDPPGLFQDPRTGFWWLRKTWSPGPGLKRQQRSMSLGTKSKAAALRAYGPALAKLQMEAEGHREKPLTPAETVAKWRALLATGTVDAREDYANEIERRLGPVLSSVPELGTTLDEPVYDPKREAAALEFAQAVDGRAVPLDLFLDAFLETRSMREASRCKLAIRQISDFLRERSELATVQAVTRRIASDFIAQLVKTEGSISTAKAKVSCLSQYWDWLASRGDGPQDSPWRGHKWPKQPRKRDVRPFTRAEVAKLLFGPASPVMADFIRVGALTGMRREEIGRLRVRDCAGGMFTVGRSKTDAGVRALPIHSALAEIVARRTKGKAPDAFLFDDLPKSAGKGRDRAEKLGERFTQYRRDVGADDRREDGRSRIDFHSFRRWFVTEAIRHSGEPDWAVSEVVGHAIPRQTMTIETYYGGSLPETLKRIVESVRLPTKADLQNTEGPREEAA